MLRRTGNKDLQGAARAYMVRKGYPSLIPTPDNIMVRAETGVGRRIAGHYGRAVSTPKDTAVQIAYRRLRNEVIAQYDFLAGWGYRFTFTEADPYLNSAAMMLDAQIMHIRVYSGGEEHPALSREANNMFRAVHDMFGHAAHGHQFGPNGEEGAWTEHAKMFSPLARLAMTTETRGQNSWVNFGPHSHLPPADRPFAAQKACILPESCHHSTVLCRLYGAGHHWIT